MLLPNGLTTGLAVAGTCLLPMTVMGGSIPARTLDGHRSARGNTSGIRAVSGGGISAGIGAAGAALTGGSVQGGALLGAAAGATTGTLTDEDDIDLDD